ncbi:hypothetical protein HYV49_03440 [Candidatus Pacearchaeota archaeon]|nr:hypothetical protein [Candidatus Pacearchaeota archaeon]
MATKNELEVEVTTLKKGLGKLESDLHSSARKVNNDVNVLSSLLAQTREDLDKTRNEVERLKNFVDSIKSQMANYDVKTSSW